MSAQVFVPGPCHIYLGPMPSTIGGTVTYAYLGVTEGGMEFSEKAEEDDVMTDISGPRVPWDVAIVGKEAFLGGTLVRFVESVWASFAARIAGGTYGSIVANEVGTLLKQERKAFSVVVLCPYAVKTGYTTMPAGFFFPFAYLAGAFDMTLSVKAKRQRMSIRALPDWNPDGSGVLSKPLSSSDVTALTLPAIT